MRKPVDAAASIAPAASDPIRFPACATRLMAPFLAQPGFLLARIDQICTAIHADFSREDTLAQAEMLLLLDSLDEPDQITLARAAGVDSSTTALILNNLEARDLVMRRNNPRDRRKTLVQLTARGRKRLPAVHEAFRATQACLVEPLDAASVPRLIDMLRQIGGDPMSPAPLWVPEGSENDSRAAIVTGSPGFLCRRVLQVAQAYFQRETGEMGLTLRQFSLIFLLSRHACLSQIGFARLFGLDPSTCAVIMKNLLARKLLERRTSAEDARERVYSLTPLGRDMLEAAQPCTDRSLQFVFRAMSRGDTRLLVAQFQRIVRAHSARLRFPGALFSR